MAKGFFEIGVVSTDKGQHFHVADRFPFGSGSSDDQNSALVRPYRKFLLDRSTIGNVRYVFLRENDRYFILAALVHTKAGRILFFPGVRGRTVSRESGPIRRRGPNDADRVIDHLRKV